MSTNPRVERLWPGSTVAILASGPSLTDADVAYVRGRVKVIAINTSVLKAPWADVMYACDARWWRWHDGMPQFQGLKFGLDRTIAYRDVTVLKKSTNFGLSLDPEVLNTGMNSGYQAIGLSYHLGASRILLLGYDMQRGPKGEEHWHPDHPNRSRSPYSTFVKKFASLVKPLREAGVEVVNCSRRTALKCWPQMPIEQALPESVGLSIEQDVTRVVGVNPSALEADVNGIGRSQHCQKSNGQIAPSFDGPLGHELSGDGDVLIPRSGHAEIVAPEAVA